MRGKARATHTSLLAPDADPADVAPAFVQLTRDMAQRDGWEIPEGFPEDFSLFRLQPLTDLRSDTSVMSFKDGHGVGSRGIRLSRMCSSAWPWRFC